MTATKAANAIISRFGFLVIPVNPATIIGELKGQHTNQFGGTGTALLFRYVRPATAKEWKECREFLKQKCGMTAFPRTPRGWQPWVLEIAPGEPEC
jgi:hypothetical protein